MKIKKCSQRSTEDAKLSQLTFHIGDLDLPQIRMRCTSRRQEENKMDKCAFSGNAIANRTHVLQACEMYKEERDRLGEKVIEIDEFEHADVW